MFINDRQHLEGTAVLGSVLDEVVGPDMVPVLWTLSDARTIVEPEAPSLRLLMGNPQPLFSPDPLDALMVHMPAILLEQSSDAPIAVAPVLTREFHDSSRQRPLIITLSYTEAYKKYRAEKGRSTKPNLSFSSRMLSAMSRQIRARKNGVTIRLSGNEGYKPWRNEQMGREFFAISDKRLEKIAGRVLKWVEGRK